MPTPMIPRDPAIIKTHSRGESLALELDALAGMVSGLAATVILVILFVRRGYHKICPL
jgi:hypothetical protein